MKKAQMGRGVPMAPVHGKTRKVAPRMVKTRKPGVAMPPPGAQQQVGAPPMKKGGKMRKSCCHGGKMRKGK